MGKVAAMLLLVGLCIQTLTRLGMLWVTDGSISIVAVHAFNIATLAAFAGVAMRIGKGRALPKLLLALALAAGILLLSTYDLASAVALYFHQRIQPLSFLPIFYCNAENVASCARVYPSYAGIVGLLWLACTAVIYRANDSLAAFATIRVVKWGIAITLILATALWLFATPHMMIREPLVRFLKTSKFGAEPRGLITIPRPHYRVLATAGAKPRPLVLIVVDSLRADGVGLAADKPSNTPFLQSLYGTGKLHDLGPSVATCATSYCGIIGLLSSSDWATLQKGPPLTISDVLAANGYRNHFLLSGPHRRVLNLAALYGPHVTTMLDDSSPDSRGLADDREQVRHLAQLKLHDKARSFIFIHLMSAHGGGGWFGPKRLDGSYAENYTKRVAQADNILRQLFETLARRGLIDDAVVVITADHGERLSGEYGHGGNPDIATALVPLLIYDAKADWHPAKGKGIVSAADVAPTLLTAADIAIPFQWQGHALKTGSQQTAAPTDGNDIAAFVGYDQGWQLVGCNIKNGHIKGDPALFDKWSRGWTRRSDAARCAKQ